MSAAELGRLTLGASLAVLLGLHPASGTGGDVPPQTAPATRPTASSVRDAEGAAAEGKVLRGSGYLILDHRDSQARVKEQLRKFVQEVRSSVPPGLGREETRRQVDAFLESDLASAEGLPQLALEFSPGVMRDNLITYLEATASARQSRQICPLYCPVEAMFRNGFHIHLTRPAGGPGDSVLALEFHDAAGDAAARPQTSVGARYTERESLLDRYPVADDGRKPIGQLFGVRVFLGEPVIPESSQLPPE